MDPVKLMRSLLVGSATLLALVSMFVIQSKFDAADRRAALGLAQDYRAKGGWTIPELLDARHPGSLPTWDVQTQSSCLHHYEKVAANIAGTRYEFMVDIDGPSIHPGNHESEAVVAQLGDDRPGYEGGAPAAASASAPRPPGAP